MSKCKLTKEELLQLVKDFNILNDRSPKLKEIKNINGFPNIKVYYRVFETTTWNDILELAGLSQNRTTKNKHTKESLKNILIDIYTNFQKVPTCEDCGSEYNLPSPIVFYDRFSTTSWNAILKECGLPYNHYQGYTKQDALLMLKDSYMKYGKVLTSAEWNTYKLAPNYGYYSEKFGSFEEACYLIGLIEKPLTRKNRIEKSLEILKELASTLQRCPTISEYEKINHNGFSRRDLEKHLNMKYSEVCIKHIPNYKFKNNTMGKMCVDNNGKMCKSMMELTITNFLIHNNIEYNKEFHYRDVINTTTTDNRRFDWRIKINNKYYYIEYLGLYKTRWKKISELYEKRADLKISDLKKYGVWDSCFFIYPSDLKRCDIHELFNTKFNMTFKEYKII